MSDFAGVRKGSPTDVKGAQRAAAKRFNTESLFTVLFALLNAPRIALAAAAHAVGRISAGDNLFKPRLSAALTIKP